MRPNQKNKLEQIGLERIRRLFELAEKEFELHPERSHRYIEIALKISTRNRVRIPPELKYQYCKKCKKFLKAGKNASVTKAPKWTEIWCLECGSGFKHRGQQAK